MNKYLVAVLAEYVDACAIITSEDGEFGGEGHMELKDTKELILGTYQGKSEEDVIQDCSTDYDVSPDILIAYRLY